MMDSVNKGQADYVRLRRAVLLDPVLQQRLREVTDKNEFISRLAEVAAELGLEVAASQVAALAATSLVSGSENTTKPANSELRDWVPMEVSSDAPDTAVVWCYMGGSRFTEPFFEDTIRRQFRIPFSRAFRHRTSIETVGELVDHNPGLQPTGFIFHMSRCGSTLVSQMLAALEKNIVISEAPPIDSVLNTKTAVGNERRGLWLRWIVGALGQKRFDAEQHLFIKFDSWNTLDLDVVRRTFPSVPWIFLYRDPVEVIVSQMRQRGLQMVPGAVEKLLPDVSREEAIAMPTEEYCARVLETICKAAIAHSEDAKALFVNYSQLPAAVTANVLEHFDVVYDSEEIAKMQDAANFNAKTPQLFFEPDSVRKREEATDEVLAAATRLYPLYHELERLRLQTS